MALQRAISSSLYCNSCRYAVITSFISSPSTNVTLWPRITARVPSRPSKRPFTSTRPFQEKIDALSQLEEEVNKEQIRISQTKTRKTQKATEDLQNPIHPVLDQSDITSKEEPPIPTNTDSNTLPDHPTSIPWYLRTSVFPTPAPAPSLPDLPRNPPPLLEPLLHYLSMTAGLDDLHLLDLRHLDPPPALGPKLIMIIGTARSEKHLHVSADRFCRWLRREHSLRANAAGLLGRNELKIKLRRKAKRMKMLANVGGQEPEGNLDDGIRTGWICCTLGKIEAHPEDRHMPGDDGGSFVGFREVRPGVNVVVQMFVEAKRAEIDLETLWGGVVKTQDREGKAADRVLEDLEREGVENESRGGDERVETSLLTTAQEPLVLPSHSPDGLLSRGSSPAAQWVRPKTSVGDPFPPASDPSPSGARQIRRLHTIGL